MKQALIGIYLIAASIGAQCQQWFNFEESLQEPLTVYKLEEVNEELFVLGGFDYATNLERFTGYIVSDDLLEPFGVESEFGYWKSLEPFQDVLVFGGTGFLEYDNNLDSNNIMDWDGNEWDNLDQGICCLPCEVNDMVSFVDELIVVGNFSSEVDCDDSFWANMAVWDGFNWSKMGGTTGEIHRIIEYDGKLVVTGDFISVSLNNITPGAENFIYASRIAWTQNGEWGTFGTGCNGTVYDAILDAVNERLIVVGSFSSCGEVEGTVGVAAWNGEEWEAIGGGLEGFPLAIEYYHDQLYVGGTDLFPSGDHLGYFDGVEWRNVSGTTIESGIIYDLKSFQEDLYIGGEFDFIGSEEYNGLAKYYLHPDSVVWDTTTNIHSFNEPRVSIFPNPASHRVNIRFDGVTPLGSEYRILSSSGQELHTDVIREDTFKLDLRKWSPGLIILEIQTTHGVLREKILIE